MHTAIINLTSYQASNVHMQTDTHIHADDASRDMVKGII